MIIPASNRLKEVKEYYFATKLREIRHRNAQGENIINLGIGNPDLPPPDSAIKALLQAAVEPGNHGYQAYKGIPQLRKAFSSWYFSSYGVGLDADNEILPLMGSKEGIMHISMAFLNPGDQVLIPNPGYPTYSSVSDLMGAESIPYELSAENDWQPDFDKLERMDLSGVKIMWVSYPHMPTGAPAKKETFEKLVAFGRKHKILICHDNPYSFILNPYPMSILSVAGAKEVVLELNSLSKSHHMAGWRLGVLSGAEDYINTVLRVKSNMDSGMFLPVQLAAANALENGYQWHKEQNEIYAKRRETVYQILDLLGCEYSREHVGMFVWARVPQAVSGGEEFSEWLLNGARVFAAPGFIFGSQGSHYIRFSLCASIKLLEEALMRIKRLSVPQI
ncbi:MAG: aminotransferase class I/II-fold pyridoxal phosphate-dependent enzyme [Bacteroidia bacterium]|nr:aminotransferase class I/II-fold pyridoxal phosphate-dependent enzyme [Bacteroidia bacterium]